MNIARRAYNAFKTGGAKKVFRKAFFKTLYRINNLRTRHYVHSAQMRFGLNVEETRNKKVIVSLTSYKARFNAIGMCLKSLLLQDYKPDRIVVYFGNDVVEQDITDEMKAISRYGVEYRFVDSENIKSYKKFYYAMQEFPDDIVITADDDVLYPRYWLSHMMRSYEKYPSCVSAWRLHLMLKDKDGNIKPYGYWKDQYRGENKPGFALFPTGVGGVLYPPHCLHTRVLDKETFIKYCPNADDVWLKCMSVMNRTKVVWVPSYEVSFEETDKNQKGALSDMNVGLSANDRVIRELLPVLGISVNDFFKV